MKKILFVMLSFVLCFLFSSISQPALFRVEGEPVNHKLPDENSQKLYAIINAVEEYTPVFEQSSNPTVDKLAAVFASNMVVDYSAVADSLADNNQDLVITASFIDPDKFSLVNNTPFEFSQYDEYISRILESAKQQIYSSADDRSIFTKEYNIRVFFMDTENSMEQKAVLNNSNLDTIKSQCLKDAERIYSEYLNQSEISTAFFCKSIKEMPADNIVSIYNENNLENQITEEWQIKLFADYSRHYIDSLIIENIVKSDVNADMSTGTINYKIEKGEVTIDNACKMLLDTYYTEKQPPVERDLVIEDFGEELSSYAYGDETQLTNKSFNFTYTQDLNEFTINDDFYQGIANHIYEEFILFESIFGNYYPQIEQDYFFVERPFGSTTIITDNTGSSRYRQLSFSVTGPTDCYVKLYSYNISTDSLDKMMFEAYIKSGETVEIFIPEGDYIFKYATGEKWYGDVHKFSTDGQYFAGSNVISVHEYMMTTTIELGAFESGSIPTYSQTPDNF